MTTDGLICSDRSAKDAGRVNSGVARVWAGRFCASIRAAPSTRAPSAVAGRRLARRLRSRGVAVGEVFKGCLPYSELLQFRSGGPTQEAAQIMVVNVGRSRRNSKAHRATSTGCDEFRSPESGTGCGCCGSARSSAKPTNALNGPIKDHAPYPAPSAKAAHNSATPVARDSSPISRR